MKKALFVTICLFALKALGMEERKTHESDPQLYYSLLTTNLARSAFLIRKKLGTRNFLGVSMPYYGLFVATASSEVPIKEDIYTGPFSDERFSPVISPDGTLLLAWSHSKHDNLFTIDTKSGKTLRKDSTLKNRGASVLFSNDSSILIMRNVGLNGNQTSIEHADKEAWIAKGFNSLTLILKKEAVRSTSMSCRQIHCFTSGLIVAFDPEKNIFICLKKEQNGSYKPLTIRPNLKEQGGFVSRIIWGTDLPIAAISLPESNTIMFSDFSEKKSEQRGIEVPKFDKNLIGCFSPNKSFFACTCSSWKGQLLIIDCEDRSNPRPNAVLDLPAWHGTVSNLDWRVEGLYTQSDWYLTYLCLIATPEKATTDDSASYSGTNEKAIEASAEGLLSSQHAQ